ncbi:MAG TPA: hypothetical protein VFK10_11630 [Burkholderiaceae bacterium]|nr:hypothetical protein [Burkholderiaceae bacterium]
MNSLEKSVSDMRALAQTLFPGGFYDTAGELAPEFRSEVPLRLMYGLRDSGVQRWQLEALTLTLRDVGEAAPLQAEAALDPAQLKVLDEVRAEDDLPAVFKALLDAVAPRLRRQKDLVAFYGVMNNVCSKWDTMADLLHRDADAV